MHNIFAIITVVKNNPRGLEQTLSSVFSQTYTQKKSIIIDGGSTDTTQEILKEFKNKCVIISEPDEGIYDAMNKGIELLKTNNLKSNWCIFLNAGDQFVDENILTTINKSLEFLINQDINKNYSVLFGHTEEVLATQTILKKSRPLHTMPLDMPTCHQSMVFSTDLLINYLYDSSYKICGDLELLARILKTNLGLQVVYLDFPIARVEAIGLSNTQWRLAIKERLRVQKLYYTHFKTKISLWCFILRIYFKKALRFFLPLSLQLKIRKWIYKS